MTAPEPGSRYSSDTPVTEMGLSSQQISKLSPAGKKLTKDDLVLLLKGVTTPNAGHATLADIEVIRSAFGPAIASTQPTEAGTNCCCTPCCCAAAVIKPLRQIA